MIKRQLADQLTKAASQFPLVGLFGPRQSGKTTLVKATFPDYSYVNLEDLEVRRFASEDPKGFLNQHSNQLILDEVQHVPDLFSYLQIRADEDKQTGKYILTGSQNYLMMESVSQSLAGRIALLYLLPVSWQEISETKPPTTDWKEIAFQGMYPELLANQIDRDLWYRSYIQTYIERDVRQLKSVQDLSQFQLFLRLCAGRVGNLVNLSSLAKDTGITHNTAKAWLSVLEASFLIFQVRPHFKNFNKRLIKAPKLYFYDTGLVSWLLQIETSKQLQTHYAVGQLYENLIMAEYHKYAINRSTQKRAYFWREKAGHEIDLVTEDNNQLIPVELKSGQTINADYFKNINYIKSLSDSIEQSFIIYAGEETQQRHHVTVYPWHQMQKVFEQL